MGYISLFATLLQVAIAVHIDYTTLCSPSGDGLPDFSFCGYHSSTDPLPSSSSASTHTLGPTGDDMTSAIQASLDSISANGGGVLTLVAGTYLVNGTLSIASSTIVRGAGPGKTILSPGNANDVFITLGTAVDNPVITPLVNITDDYVPVGATTFTVEDASCLWEGRTVMVQRNVTAAWVAASGMDQLYRNGAHQTWLGVSTSPDGAHAQTNRIVQQPRAVKCINGNQVTVDVPLADSLNRSLMVPQVAGYDFPQGSSEMGFEGLSITLSPTCSGAPLNGSTCLAPAIDITSWTTDSWIRNVDITGFNAAVRTNVGTMRVTIDSVNVFRDGPTDAAAGYAFDISIAGTQTLVKDCATFGLDSDQDYPVAVQSLTAGPNAVRNYYVESALSPIQPHQRWAFGFLVENSDASLSFINRGIDGSGHGWTINAGVIWNSNSPLLSVDSPPTGTNWCIGCRSGGINENGNKDVIQQNGTFVARNRTVTPHSLFEAQLAKRLD